MKRRKHMSASIDGLLNLYKKKRINFLIDDDGKTLSDKEARAKLARLKNMGHTLLPTSDECIGFDPFGGGCPGHTYEENLT